MTKNKWSKGQKRSSGQSEKGTGNEMVKKALKRVPARELQPQERGESGVHNTMANVPSNTTRIWTAADIISVMVCATACLSLLIFVIGSFWLLQTKVIGPTMLGAVSGTGLLGIGTLILKFLKLAFGRGGRIA